MAENDTLPVGPHGVPRIQMGNPPPATGAGEAPQRVEGQGDAPTQPPQAAPQPYAAPPGFHAQVQQTPEPEAKPQFKPPPGFVPVGGADDHREPGPTVNDEPLTAEPGPVADRLKTGNSIWSQIPKPSDQVTGPPGFWENVGDALKTFHDAIDLGPAWQQATKESYEGGVENLKQAVQDIISNRPASGVVHAAAGVLGAGLAPVNGVAMAVERKVAAGIASITGNREFGDKVGQLAGLTMGGVPSAESKALGMAAPLLKDKEGNFHRFIETGDGKVTLEKLGPTPTEEHFAQSAKNIAPEATPAKQSRIAKALKQLWNREGTFPVEAEEAAARSPVVARDLNAAENTPRKLPGRPVKSFLEDLENKFTRLKGAYTADRLEMRARVKAMPDSVKDAATQEAWYAHGEGAPTEMSEQMIDDYNNYMLDLKREEAENWEYLQMVKHRYASKDIEMPFDIGEFDPNYMHRMVVGKTPEIDRLTGHVSSDPARYVDGGGLLGRNPGSLKERTYFTMVNQDTGERILVAKAKDGKSVMSMRGQGQGQRAWNVKDAAEKLGEDGKPIAETGFYPGIEITGEDGAWKLQNAWSSEIEAQTSTRYYKNALAVTIDNILKQRAARRAIEAIETLRNTDEWRAYTMGRDGQPGIGHNGGPPLDPETGVRYVSPRAEPFKNDHMDPRLANVIDDFFAPQLYHPFVETLQKVNDLAISSLFWTPVPHALNAGAWWFTERGWANFTPSGMGSLFRNSAKALYQLRTMGNDYQLMLKSGSSLVRGGLDNPQFYRDLLEQTGTAIEKVPGFWNELGRIAAVPTKDLVEAWYRGTKHVLWTASDFFALQRTYELMDLRGLSMQGAIEEMERTMPNYRIHSNMGMDYLPGKAGEFLEGAGRAAHTAFTRSLITEFGRYNQNILRAFTNMAKDLVHPASSMAERVDAMGKFMAMGTLSLVVYPALSAAWHKLTGNDEQMFPNPGPGKIVKQVLGEAVQKHPDWFPDSVNEYYKDLAPSLVHAIVSMLANSPTVKALDAAQAWSTGTPMHSTGRPFIEPADQRNWRWIEMLSQGATAAGKLGIEPLNALDEWAKHGHSLNDFLMENIVGMHIQDEKAIAARERAYQWQEKQSMLRKIKPPSPLEHWMQQQMRAIIEGKE
jgi:hypothetical protein